MVSKYLSEGRRSIFRDELIALAQSIHEVNQRSRWDLELVALCLEDKVNEKAMEELRKIGFTVIAKPAFTTWAEIEAVGTYTPDILDDYNNKDLEVGAVPFPRRAFLSPCLSLAVLICGIR